MSNKQKKQKAKHELRLRRLVARLTLLNSQVPQAGSSEHQRKTWADERGQIIRQLRRHGIEIE